MFLDVTIRTGLVGLGFFLLIFRDSRLDALGHLQRRKEDFFRSWSICLFACLSSFAILALFGDALYGVQGTVLYVNLAMIGILRTCRGKTKSLSCPSEVTVEWCCTHGMYCLQSPFSLDLQFF